MRRRHSASPSSNLKVPSMARKSSRECGERLHEPIACSKEPSAPSSMASGRRAGDAQSSDSSFVAACARGMEPWWSERSEHARSMAARRAQSRLSTLARWKRCSMIAHRRGFRRIAATRSAIAARRAKRRRAAAWTRTVAHRRAK
eukprot:scaffold244126_cov30-Tisochrysis_lutea.AAC.11